jgi:hypothetical protein
MEHHHVEQASAQGSGREEGAVRDWVPAER